MYSAEPQVGLYIEAMWILWAKIIRKSNTDLLEFTLD